MCGTVTVTELLSPMSTVAICDLSTEAGLKSSVINMDNIYWYAQSTSYVYK